MLQTSSLYWKEGIHPPPISRSVSSTSLLILANMIGKKKKKYSHVDVRCSSLSRREWTDLFKSLLVIFISLPGHTLCSCFYWVEFLFLFLFSRKLVARAPCVLVIWTHQSKKLQMFFPFYFCIFTFCSRTC